VTLAHDVHGDGPPLLLVHGGTLDRRMWEPNMAALTERHRVVRCDQRGFGASPPPAGPYSHADDLRALLEALEI
jgi:pimeloyl-ACP methyl ester carboxylesterase